MAFVKPPARNMPPGSEPWAQWVEEQMSSVTKQTVAVSQYAERAAGGVNSALEGNIQNRDEINRVFEVTEKSMQLADGAVVWSTLDPELPEDVPINPNVIWYTYVPETREVLRMWQWGYYDDVEGVYVEDWYQAQLGADSIHDEAITNAKILNLDAGKITTGFLDAARIQANSIVASKLAATAIDGMTITGSTIQTSSSANTGIKIDSANGLRAWAGGNLGVQISPSIKNGMAVRNPVGEMVPLSDAAFGTVSIARSNTLPTSAPQTSGAWSAWTRHNDTEDDCILTFTAVSTRYIVSWSQSWATSYDSSSSKQTGVQVGLSTGGSGNLIPSGNGGQITGLVGYLQERSADVGDRVRSVTMQGPLSTVVGQTYTLRMYFRYNANGPGTHNISVAARTITATPVY